VPIQTYNPPVIAIRQRFSGGEAISNLSGVLFEGQVNYAS